MDKIVKAKDSDNTLTELEFIFYTKQTDIQHIFIKYLFSLTYYFRYGRYSTVSSLFIAGHSFIDNLTDIYPGPSVCLLLEIQYLTRSRWPMTP